MTTADDADSTSGTDTTTGNETTGAGNGAEGSAGAPGADDIAANGAASAPIPPPPAKGSAKKPAAPRAPKAKAPVGTAADASAGPSYQFEPQGGPAVVVGGSQDLTAAMVEQLAADPLVAVDGERWTDDVGPRGRVISVSRGAEGGPTTTFEETLPLGSTDGLANEARVRLRSRFGG